MNNRRAWRFMDKRIYLFLLLFFPLLSRAQAPAELLKKGGAYYEADQVDSAGVYYRRAYQTGGPNVQIRAIAGLISLGILRSDLRAADSLVTMGDKLAEAQELDLETYCYYLTRKGEYLRSSSQFPAALAQHQEVVKLSADLPDSTLVFADALYYTALTFERLSAYDSSITYIERAYEIYQRELDTTSVKFGNICNGLGVCYYRANRYREAKQFYLKSKDIAEKQLGPVSTDLAMALSNLSAIFRAEENYSQAITASERALKIYRALEDESGMASAYYALGIYHYFLGDYGQAKNYLEACVEIRERLFDPRHYSLIGPYEVLGIAFEESGHYQKTLQYLKKARPIILHNYGSGSLSEAFNYENTAICYKNMGHLDSAQLYMQRSNRLITSLLPANDYSLGVHYFNFANIHYLRNNLARARSLLDQSAAIYRNLGMRNSSEYAQNLALQALMLAEEEQWSRADILFAQALELVHAPDALRAGDMDFQLSPRALWLLNEYSDYLYRKYRATGQAGLLEQFEDYSQAYLTLSDQFRQQFIDPYTKSILIKDNAEVYSRNIGIYAQLYFQNKEKEYLDAAFNFTEYGRTCLLRDLQDEKVASYAGLPDSLLQKERDLRKKISQLNQQLLDDPVGSSAKTELLEVKEDLNQYVRNLSASFPDYYDLRFKSTVPGLEEIQAKVGRDEVLVEYMQDDTAVYALIINPDLTDLVYLGNRERIETAVLDWKADIASQDKDALTSSGVYLYETLWQPLENLLSRRARVTIMPIGMLFYLNFEALPLGATAERFLIHAYNISYALSANVLFRPEKETRQGNMVAVAPGFEERIKQSYLQQLDSLEWVDEEYLTTVRQPWSLKMVKRLKQQFVNQTYTGLAATEPNIKHSIQKGKVLLFGTHAIADAIDPLRSRLILAKELGEQKEDGYLHAYELYAIPLEAELAILNACESGVGQLQAGEGMISLAYSIHYAGCPSTVMSLWKVDEKVSTQITESFMQYLSAGLPKSQALRRAKLDYLSTAPSIQRHPFYWGGMVLMGKDGDIALKKKASLGYWLAGFGLVLLLGFLFWYYLAGLKNR